ncbi:MAG: PilZ domain-containing protein [SAR324 cluster bacterium]|nr:PilZ domain-containing protein [SAR324 cluster bacterium]
MEKNKDDYLKKILAKIEQELDEEEAEEVIEALEEMSASKNPVKFVLQEPPIPFQSRFVIRHNHVLLLKPEKIEPYINEHSIVMLEYTDIDNKIRHQYLIALKVIRPDVRISENQSAIICQIPKEFLSAHANCQLRQRYAVLVHGWQLYFPKQKISFPVSDISRSGISFEIKPEQKGWFTKDKLYHELSLRWEGNGELKILFMRVIGAENNKVSSRMGLTNENMRYLNKWISRIK